MIRRSTKLLIEGILGAIVLVAVVLGVGLYRLTEGPIEIAFMTPHLETAAEEALGGNEVSIARTVLAWNEQEKRPDLRVEDVVIRDSEGFEQASLPDASVSISLAALMEGEVAPARIALRGIELSLVRDPAGNIELLGVHARSAEHAGETELDTGDLFARWLAADPSLGALGYLESLSIRSARLTLNDRQLLRTWEAPSASLTLRRSDVGLSGSALLTLGLEDGSADFDVTFGYNKLSALWTLALGVSRFDSANLVEFFPEMEDYVRLETKLDADINAVFAEAGAPKSVRFEVSAVDGAVAIPAVNFTRHAFSALSLKGRYGRESDRLTLDDMRVEFQGEEGPGPRITADAEITGIGALLGESEGRPARLSLGADLTNMQAEDIGSYWPEGIGGNGRPWVVENITEGDLTRGWARVVLTLDSAGDIGLEEMEGGLEYAGLTAHYLRPMPPITDIEGTAEFGPSYFALQLDSGRVDTIALGPGKVRIHGLDGDDHRIDIDFEGRGRLGPVLALIDHPRLALVSKLGLPPEKLSGQASVSTQLSFPLIADLDVDTIDARSQATLAELTFADAWRDLDLEAAAAVLEVDTQHMLIDGEGQLTGEPVSFTWEEVFTAGEEIPSRIEVMLPEITDALRSEAGFAWDGYLSGPLAAEVVYNGFGGGKGRVFIDADLERTQMAVPELDWRKEGGVAGRAELDMTLTDGQVTRIDSLRVTAGSLQADGWVEPSPDDGIAAAGFETLAIGDQSLWGVTVEDRGERLEVFAEGGIVDASRFLSGDDAAEEESEGDEPAEPLRINIVSLEEVRFAPKRYLEEVSVEMERDGLGWRKVNITGRLPEALWSQNKVEDAGETRWFKIAYEPRPEGEQGLFVETVDAGALLRALDVLDSMQGGMLRIRGKRPSHDPQQPLRARISIETFAMLDTPILTRLLTLASLTGFLELLSEEGLAFNKLVGEFTAVDQTLSTDLIRAYGPSLGLTAQGTMDIEDDALDLKGTVVPAYTVNRILGAIPLLGDLLIGGEGEGVFAVTYAMTGPMDDPRITVNPLSVLTPGFLRGLFDVEAADGDEDSTPRALPEGPGR